MRAAVIREYGPPDVLVEDEVDDPAPAAGDVVVELRAAALNRRDTYLRSGANPAYRFPLPLVLGSDGAGIRRDTGEEVVVYPLLRWGDRPDAPAPGYEILGGPSAGTYAELVAVPAENVFPKPRRLSWQEAAALPLAGLTAYRALFTRGQLQAGETVLVLGAGSGVSTVAVALAHQAGARVLVTSSSAAKVERARELGAEAGVDYTADGWVDEVRALAGGDGVDLVVDSAGATVPESLRCLRPGGRVVTFGATAGATAQLEVRPFYFGQFSLLGTTMGSPSDFAGLLRMVEEGSWAPVVDSVRPLGEAAAAHAQLESAGHFGKLVLEIA